MRKIKKYLSIYLNIFIVLINLFNPMIVKASITQNVFSQTTVSVGGVDVTAYEYTDSSLLSNTVQCYWVENNEVYRAPLDDAFTVIFNKTFGLAVKPSFLSNFLVALNGSLWGSGLMLTEFFSGCPGFVYNGSSIVGVALDNLSGFSLAGDNNFKSYNIPSSVVNNVWNVWNDYIEENSILDFINIGCYDKSTAEEACSYNNTNFQQTMNVIDEAEGTLFSLSYLEGRFNTSGGTSGRDLYFKFSDPVYFVQLNDGDLDNIIRSYGLSTNNYTIEYITVILNSEVQNISAKAYSKETNQQVTSATQYNLSNTSSSISTSSVTLVSSYRKVLPYNKDGGYITLYRSANLPQQISNNTYQKSYYTSNITNNYSTSNNNTTVITNNDNSNAYNNNSNIYNQSQTTTNNNTTENNYYYNQSENDNSVTNIIYNYYPENGDDDDDDDDSIWDALLKALGNFLKKIGELIGVILTGIIEICTDVLDAIASITESFTGITDFISSIFGFLPSEITAVLTLGITLAVLISLIKMFRG